MRTSQYLCLLALDTSSRNVWWVKCSNRNVWWVSAAPTSTIGPPGTVGSGATGFTGFGNFGSAAGAGSSFGQGAGGFGTPAAPFTANAFAPPAQNLSNSNSYSSLPSSGDFSSTGGFSMGSTDISGRRNVLHHDLISHMQ